MKLWGFWRASFWTGKSPIIPVIRLEGVIAPSGRGVRRGLSLASVDAQLKKAFATKKAAAVALIINSPGGSPVQSDLIAKRIRNLASKYQLPVLAFVEDVAASGGYWLAAAADEIYVADASIIGSIGVVSGGFGFPQALEKLGIERRLYTSGKSKAMLDPFSPEKPEEVARLKELQEDIHQQFISYVQQRRGGKLNGPEDDLFSGAFWTGRQARALGLVDGVADCHSFLKQRFGEDVRQLHIAAKRKLFGEGGFGFGSAHHHIGAGLADQLIDSAQERAYYARFGL